MNRLIEIIVRAKGTLLVTGIMIHAQFNPAMQQFTFQEQIPTWMFFLLFAMMSDIFVS